MIKKYIPVQILENENLELVGKKTNSMKKIEHNDSTAKNTRNTTQKFSVYLHQWVQKIGILVNKNPNRASVVRAFTHSNLIKKCRRTRHANMHLAQGRIESVRSRFYA